MGFLKRDVKFKGHRGVLITTAALNNISEEHEKKRGFIPQIGFVVVVFYI